MSSEIQFSRFMLDLDEWDDEDGKRVFDISAGANIIPEGDNTYVFTSFRLNRIQYSELLDELRRFHYAHGTTWSSWGKESEVNEDDSFTFEIIDDDPLFLMCNLDGVNVQLFFKDKDEVLEFQNFLIKNK